MKITVVVFLSVSALLVHAATADTPTDYSKDPPFVNKLTLTFVKYDDQTLFDNFVMGSHDPNYLIHKTRYIPSIRSSYTVIQGARDAGPGLVGLRYPGASQAINASLGVYDAGSKLYDKYLANPKQIMSVSEVRDFVIKSLADAQQNGSLPELLGALGERLHRNVKAGNFEVDVETLATMDDLKDLMALTGQQDAKSQQRVATAIAELSNKIQKLVPTPAEIKEADEKTGKQKNAAKIQKDFDDRLLSIDTHQSQLTVLSSIASATGVKDAEKPIAVAQLGINAASAYNNWNKVHQSFDAKQATSKEMSAANWAMAANLTTAALVAYQMFGAKGDDPVMAELEVIRKMLETIDKKLDYLIDLAERNFKSIEESLDEQRYLLDKILANTDFADQQLIAESLRRQVEQSRQISSEFDKWSEECSNRKSSHCKPNDKFAFIYDVISRRKGGEDDRIINDTDTLIRTFMVKLTDNYLEEYRQYNSGTLLLTLTRKLVDDRLAGSRLSPAGKTYYQWAKPRLDITNDHPTDFVNPKVWNGSVKATIMLKQTRDAKPSKDLIDTIESEGRRIDSYYKIAASRELHDILRLELSLAAGDIQQALGQLEKSIYVAYARADAIAKDDRVPNNPAACDKLIHPNLGTIDVEKVKANLSQNRGYGRFAVLQALGLGSIEQCYYFDALNDASRIPLFSYYRFIWKEDKVDLAAKFGVPIGNAIPESELKAMRSPSGVFVTRIASQFNHAARATDAKRTTFIMAMYDLHMYQDNPDRSGKGWANLGEYEGHPYIRDYYYGIATRRNLLTDTDVANLDQVIDQVVTSAFAVQLAATENVRVGEEAKAVQNPVFPVFPNQVQSVNTAMIGYRLRFYLLNAYVQQQSLDKRASLNCQSAVAKVSKDGQFAMNLHPAGFAQAMVNGVFREQIDMAGFVDIALLQNGTPRCMSTKVPSDFEEAALKLGTLSRSN